VNEEQATVLTFLVVGAIGILTTMMVGASLLRNPSITAAKFSAWVAAALGATLLLAVILPARLSQESLTVGGLIALVSLPTTYAISFYWVKRRSPRDRM